MKKAIYIIAIISLIIAILYTINIYSFQTYNDNLGKVEVTTEKAYSSDRYIVMSKGTTIYQETRNPTNIITNLTYEEFITNNGLVAINADAIPYLKYIRETDEKKAKVDATLEPWELKELTGNREVRSYKIGKILEDNQYFNNLSTRPSATSPYGYRGQVRATSRTIAKYTSTTQKNLSVDEAWILAHSRTLSSNLTDYSKARIDKVQKAIWKLKNVFNFKENFSDNEVAEKVAANLCQEAIWLRESVAKKQNLSAPIEDNMVNKYQTEVAVSYDDITKEFLVGPFSINYVRDVHEPIKGGLSEMIAADANAGNLIIYSGIVGANVYAIVGGSEQLLTEWEFVYNDVTVTKDGVKRNAVINAQESGDIDDNIYPYPNEQFYIKFKNPNNSIEAITKLEFDLQTLNASGTVRELKGTYDNINWVVGESWSQQFVERRDEGYWVNTGYYQTDKDGKKTWISTRYWQSKWVNYYNYTYNSYIEDVRASVKNAATLYQIQNAKIYGEKQSIKLKVGTRHNGYKYSDYCIPLTMEIGGAVWVDGTEEQESKNQVNGTRDSNESVKSGIEVKLYTEQNQLKATTKTDGQGKYVFKYVQIGPKYYVEFAYDWMKYKATKELCTNNVKGSLGDFVNNPEKYLNSSHASENVNSRKAFNGRFYEITTDKAVDRNVNKTTDISYTYQNNSNPYFQISTVQEFIERTSTKTCNIILPLQRRFAIAEGGDKYLQIGSGDKGTCAITTTNKNTDLDDVYEAGDFLKIQEYLKNINLGLVERCPADFTIKSDVKSTTFTINESTSDQNMGFNLKENTTFNIENRTDEYYATQYKQEISSTEYNWRRDFTENNLCTTEDESQIYVLYEFTIKNQSPLISGYITELSNYYDKEYVYPVDNDETSFNFYKENSIYKELTVGKFMQYPSYIVKNGQIIKQVNWNSTSKFRDSNNTDLNKMYTTSLSDILLEPNDTLTIYVYYKVDRREININTDTEYKYGEYIILDNEDRGKQNIAEINSYRALDYVEKDVYNTSLENVGGSRVDIDSNPGNIDGDSMHGSSLSALEIYEDDVDMAPRMQIVVKGRSSKEISGYVWEDLRTEKLQNNQLVGNALIDENENYINNVLTELIRLEYNPYINEYEEVKFSSKYEKYVDTVNKDIKENYGKQYENGEISLIKIKRRTGPQDENESISDASAFIDAGQYRFTNLIESGQYKVRFLYGDIEQLTSGNRGIIYNGHDYKSTEFKGFYSQDAVDTNLNTVIALDNTSVEMITSSKNHENYANKLIQKLQNTDSDITVNNLTALPDSNNLSAAIQNLKVSDAKTKVLVILLDRSLRNVESLLEDALSNNITVIVVATNNVALSEFNVTAGNNSLILYDILNRELSVDVIYNRIVSQILYEGIFREHHSQATDFIESASTINGQVYGRTDVMLKSQTMNYDIANVLDVEKIAKLTDANERMECLNKLAEYKMSAESYAVSINFDDNNAIKYINLGLQKIPESSLELTKEVEDITVTLSNGQTIINTRDGLTTNLQHFINDSYNIYIDEEIMHDAKIAVLYKINISNIGEVDNLMTYLKYYPFNVKQRIYERLGGSIEGLNEETLDDLLLKTVVKKVNKVYDYYDNLIFRSEVNNRQNIDFNSIEQEDSKQNRRIPVRNEFDDLKLSFLRDSNKVLIWNQIKDKNDLQIKEQIKEKVSKYNCISTTGLKEFELYPYESVEVRDGQGVSSISTYVELGRELSGQDSDFNSSLTYRNFAEIIETYSITGRRDANSVVGNFIPSSNENSTDEDDSDVAETVKLLVPFGIDRLIRYGVYIILLSTVAFVIVFIKKRYKKL